jgi:hypothetical protein
LFPCCLAAGRRCHADHLASPVPPINPARWLRRHRAKGFAIHLCMPPQPSLTYILWRGRASRSFPHQVTGGRKSGWKRRDRPCPPCFIQRLRKGLGEDLQKFTIMAFMRRPTPAH